MKKMKNKERAEKMAEKLSHKDYYEGSNKIQEIFNKLRVNHIKKLCGEIGDKKILDIGIGEGFMAKEFEIKNLWGIDISSKRCEKARKLLPGAKITAEDASKTSFDDGFFDGIICADVLEHMDQPEKATKEMLRIVKKNGFIIIGAPNESGLIFAKIVTLQTPIRNPDHVNNISLSYLIEKFNRKPVKTFNLPNIKYPFCLWQGYKFIK